MKKGTIVRWTDAQPAELFPGFFRRTLGYTARLMTVEFRSDPGVNIPSHSHPHDQVGYVVSGEIHITIDGETTVCKVGDSYAIPGDMLHSAYFPVSTIVIENFAPAREEYM